MSEFTHPKPAFKTKPLHNPGCYLEHAEPKPGPQTETPYRLGPNLNWEKSPGSKLRQF